ncbi:MAG: glycosyltransferase [Bacteroidia bacterium]
MNILFYYPDKERAISLSSLMISFKEQGHNVFLLTHSKEGELHSDVKKHGVQVFTHPISKKISLLFYIRHLFYLIRFARKHKIDVLYSHIQVANIITVFAQYFIKARVFICRHHTDCAFVDYNFNEQLFDKIINRLGKEFIVVSNKVKQQMEVNEGVKEKKIYVINLAYDFSQYKKPDPEKVKEIRSNYKANLLLLKAARLIAEKRHILLFRVVKKMISEGYDIKLMVLSEGGERKNLENFITENKLQNRIFMLGYKTDVLNYLSAADLIVHVSESEASNSIIKESSLVGKPIIACHDVGDFDDYIVPGTDGILLSKEHTEVELYEALVKIYNDMDILNAYGKNLREKVINLFDISTIIKQYEHFHISK